MGNIATKTVKVFGWALLGWAVGSVLANLVGYALISGNPSPDSVAVNGSLAVTVTLWLAIIAAFVGYGVRRVRRQPSRTEASA